MPRPQSKRDLVLKSSPLQYDRNELDAIGHRLKGSGLDDRLHATDDQDWWLEGRGGGDVLTGAGGDDLLVAGKVRQADAGTDGDPDQDDAVGVVDSTLPGGATMDGGAGNDLVVGGPGDDVIRGGDDNDSLWGGDGADLLAGGAGDDVLAPGRGNATIEGGDGIDTASWADLAYTKGRGDLAGVVLNLSDRLIRYESGDQIGEGRILVGAAGGGFVLLGEADTLGTRPELRPGGEVGFDISAGTAQIEVGGPLPAIQKFADAATPNTTERYEGTFGRTDVVVLSAGFHMAATDADGWQSWTDGTRVLTLKGFDVILIA